jgi:enamine deaminase RidA (YjgF/YER057c/UK114 family)
MAATISREMAAVVGMSALAQPDFLIEVEAVAVTD